MKCKAQKSLIADLKDKTNKCLSSRQHANDILEILSKLEDDDIGICLQCVKSVHKLFSHFLEVGELALDNKTDEGKEAKYKQWLHGRYTSAVDQLADNLHHSNKDVQELSLSVLMKLLVKESRYPVLKPTGTPGHFPEPLFKKLMHNLISPTVNNQALLKKFAEYMAFDDIQYYTLKHLEQVKTDLGDIWHGNAFVALETVSVPKVKKDEEEQELSNFLCSDIEHFADVRLPWKHRKKFTHVWVQLLKCKLSAGVIRRILMIVHDRIMPNFVSPLLLTEFLTQCYDVGGAISLLALNGLFVLIQKHNLHYPDFYTKLYALLDPTVFHVKYKARFFYLTDLFLSSTHLPSYLVAAFAKKLARISLTAPPAGLLVIVPFIYNLITRHPTCRQLVHRPDMEIDFESDPYDIEEPDPAKCRAMESCLWELKTLQYHYHPDVFKVCKKVDQGIPDTETDLSDTFDLTASDLFEKEITKKQKTTAVTFEPPSGLFHSRGDKLDLFWKL